MDKRERRRQAGQDERKDKTVVFISNEDAELLRAIAADRKLFTTRGPRVGNIHEIVTRLARVARRHPEAIHRLLDEYDETPADEGELLAVA